MDVRMATFESIDGGGPFGELFRSFAPTTHRGSSAMLYFSEDKQHWAVFPSRDVAITAAAGACRRDVGGYSNVQVYPVSEAPVDAKQYDGAIDWLVEGDSGWTNRLRRPERV